MIPAATGKPAGGGGGGGGGGRGKAAEGDDERFVEHPDGTSMPTVLVGRPDEIPESEWVDASEFDEPNLIGRWDEANYRIEANPSCPIIQESIDYWTDQHPRVGPENVAKAVRRIYGFKLRSAVAHMITAKKRSTITAEQLREALQSIPLTLAAAGFVLKMLCPETTACIGTAGFVASVRRTGAGVSQRAQARSEATKLHPRRPEPHSGALPPRLPSLLGTTSPPGD